MPENKQKKQNNAERVKELESIIALQNDKIAELERQLDRMTELLANAQRARFGQSSEKRSYVLGKDPSQLSIFNEAEVEQDVKAPEPTEETFVEAYKRKKKRTIEELTESLPSEDIVLELPEERQICDQYGGKMRLVGKKLAYQKIVMIPQQVKLLRYFTCTYACDHCEKVTGFARMVSTVAPPPLLKHSLASASTVADVMTKKYVDGLPLARQEKIWKRLGIELSRATLANWVIQTVQTWLKPVCRRLKVHLLENPVIHADETVVQVLKEPDKPATSKSRMWVYASSDTSARPVRYFEYQPDRSGKRPVAFLKGFKGCLVTDGYAAYEQVPDVILCSCWAHMKRKWREAMPSGATTKNSKAAIGYEYCNKLFALERKFADLSDEERKYARQAKAEPLLEAYWLWLKNVHPEKGSKLEEAVTYANNQKEKLSRFLEHGEVPISNNFAENAIRPFVLGRKNWLFSDSVKGADSSAVVYTLVETAKANGVDPFAYLLNLLSLLPSLGKNPFNEELDELLPWHLTMQHYLRKYKSDV